MNLTKTDAVNRILRGAGEHPVSSLGQTQENDSLMAEQILDEVNLREQMAGLHVNTTDTSFIPDADNSNKVVLPNNTLQVRGWNEHQIRNYFHRLTDGEVLLYDADREPATFNFEDDNEVFVRITQELQFEELPVQHQFSITDQAAVEYQRATLNSTTRDQGLQQIAARSRAVARAYDMRMLPHNQFNDGRSAGPRAGTRFVLRPWPFPG